MSVSEIVNEIADEHLMRLDRCDTVPLNSRKTRRKTPNTAIISEAAKKKIFQRVETKPHEGSP